MMFFVHYNSGTCNHGDHESGLDGYATEAEAREWAKKFADGHPDSLVVLIRGEFLEPPDKTAVAIAVAAERAACLEALDDLCERGPGRGAVPWQQAWRSGVQDAHAAIRAAGEGGRPATPA